MSPAASGLPLLLVLLAGATESPAQSTPQSGVLPEALRARLRILAGGEELSALKGVRLEMRWQARPQVPAHEPKEPGSDEPGPEESEKPRQPGTATRETPWQHVRIDLAYPARMRVEFRTRPRGRFARVWLLDGAQRWLGEADGSVAEVGGEEAAAIERCFALAAAIAHWDLLPPHEVQAVVQAVEGGYRSELRLGKRTLPVVRTTAANETEKRWKIGAEDYAVHGDGPLPGPEQPLRFETAAQVFELHECTTGLHFIETRFDPAHFADKEPQFVRQGDRAPNFDAPRLERHEALWFVEIEDPGEWKARFAQLHELGLALYALGQRPAGLPIYTSTGKLRVPFRPAAGKEAAAPEGHRLHRQEACVSVVLHVRAPLAQAAKPMASALLEYLRRIDRKPEGPLLLRPHVLPVDGMPGPGTELLIRAELLLRPGS